METVRVVSGAELGGAGLPSGRPVLVLVGGADGMPADDVDWLERVLRDLVPLLEQHRAVVVDGGTDVGVMRAVGRARAAAGGRFPLVGVIVEALAGQAETEPNHTHLVLVPGSAWGDEVAWLAEVASVVAGPRPSLTVLANGGAVAFDDAEQSLRLDRPLVVLRGTGRTADAIAGGADERSATLAGSPLTAVLDAEELRAHVEGVFSARPGGAG
ncbi:hypothetical protein [Saccharothrix longispora]|uniref:hypothetical protein n=1 Tax=Saccharothrix longispora TaxID=33920 RepID=UPI0028FD2D1F|nr:hypothetical protein [Saccharothrix longispora]MDU0289152.1 hypothetical protein [Saccharothrix longispora]